VAPLTKRSPVAWVLALLVIIGLLGTGFYYYFFDPYASRLLQARVGDFLTQDALAKELEAATYLLSIENGAGIYHDGALVYDDYIADGSFVADIAYAGTISAKILYRPNSGLSDIVVDGRTVLSSKEGKKSIALSPDGTSVSFVSVEGDGRKGWEDVSTHIINLGTGIETVTPGVSPVFLDNQTLIVFLKDGAYVVPLDGEEPTQVATENFSSVNILAARSADGMRIAFAERAGATSRVGVYQIMKNELSWSVSEVAGLESYVVSVAVTDNTLYLVKGDGKGSVGLFSLNLDVAGEYPVLVRVYPNILKPVKIIL